MDEQNDDEQREQRSQDASQQPELTPSQNEQPFPAHPAGWEETWVLVAESLCSHLAPRGSRQSDTVIALLFRDADEKVRTGAPMPAQPGR
jgi:hypothetical protein